MIIAVEINMMAQSLFNELRRQFGRIEQDIAKPLQADEIMFIATVDDYARGVGLLSVEDRLRRVDRIEWLRDNLRGDVEELVRENASAIGHVAKEVFDFIEPNDFASGMKIFVESDGVFRVEPFKIHIRASREQIFRVDIEVFKRISVGVEHEEFVATTFFTPALAQFQIVSHKSTSNFDNVGGQSELHRQILVARMLSRPYQTSPADWRSGYITRKFTLQVEAISYRGGQTL